MKTETWLPLFSGFYSTIWESEIESQTDYEFETIREEAKDEEEAEKLENFFYQSDCYMNAMNSARESISSDITKRIEELLKQGGFIKSLKMQRVVSPVYYNFHNDAIDIEVTYTKSNLANIETFIANHKEQYEKMLENNYTSYDGFMSSHDNFVDDSNEWVVKNAVKKSHNLGMVLDFILRQQEVEEWHLMEDMDMYVYVHIDDLREEFLKKAATK